MHQNQKSLLIPEGKLRDATVAFCFYLKQCKAYYNMVYALFGLK